MGGMAKLGFGAGGELTWAGDPYWATATAAAKHKTNKSQNARRMVPPCQNWARYSPDGIAWILCSVGTERKGTHPDSSANVNLQTEEHVVSCQLRREVNS